MEKKAWSGRFKKKLDPHVEAFNASIHFDQRLYKEDIQGSIAHARMLGDTGIIAKDESIQIIEGLKTLLEDIESGVVSFDIINEDIHMNIESLLIKRIGDVGKKLHTARSRNDQVALDMRLYSRKSMEEISLLIEEFIRVLNNLCKTHEETYMPGYTHLQKAQPITLSVHMGAYVAMFTRDNERLKDCLKRMNKSPLGAGALAGSSLKLDRNKVALELGFDGVISNPMDAVSDRDYLIEFLAAGSILGMHLSRLSEELILWNTEEFGFIELDDAFATGSSLMPQKKNPDVPELVRGKTGRLYGHLVALLTTMKGLPLAYNKDMQEDKEPVFDAIDTLKNCLNIMISFMKNLKFNKQKMYLAASKSYICATELVDYLVEKGIPFRQAHEIIGGLIHHCIEEKKYLDELDLSIFKQYSTAFNEDVYEYLKIENAVKKREFF